MTSVDDRCYFVLGTRPEIIKLSPVIDEWGRSGGECVILHTGQHQLSDMVQIFLDDLDLPSPLRTLDVGSDTQSRQVARIISGVEDAITELGRGIVIVQGDTNSTIGGALAAIGQEDHFIAHVESGCRSFNRRMPEEINRIVVDHICDLLFAATPTDLENLRREGLARQSRLVGSTGIEACLRNVSKANERSSILSRIGIRKHAFGLATIHRPQNTEDGSTLSRILRALGDLGDTIPIVFPVHPRTAAALDRYGISWPRSIVRTPPLGYLDFLALLANARFVLTDSGGVQEEAACLGTRCFTLRDETEWTFTLGANMNTLVGTEHRKIVNTVIEFLEGETTLSPFEIHWPTSRPASVAIIKELTERGPC